MKPEVTHPNDGGRMNFTIRTDADLVTGEIAQYLDYQMGQVLKGVLDTREQQIRDALVKLGWTPPGATLKTDALKAGDALLAAGSALISECQEDEMGYALLESADDFCDAMRDYREARRG